MKKIEGSPKNLKQLLQFAKKGEAHYINNRFAYVQKKSQILFFKDVALIFYALSDYNNLQYNYLSTTLYRIPAMI